MQALMAAGQPVELVRSRRRTLELRVFPDGTVQVRAPLRAPLADIRAFIGSRHAWLDKTLARVAQRPAPAPLVYEDGAEHLLLGVRVPLRICQAARPAVALTEAGIHIATPSCDPARVGDLLGRFYRAQARRLFDELVDRHFPYFAQRGHARPRLAIKDMKTRWGSLSSSGNMSLNLALVKVPVPLAEYVVVHELCHLEHANHGAGFKELMSARMPDWRQRKKALEAAPLV